MFIVFEGLDGSGKSTQAKLLKDYLEKKKKISVVLVKEPTDQPPVGDLIRSILRKKISVSPTAFQLIFCADRAEQLERVVKPALTRGQWVISDRYFYSTIAYGSLDLETDWLLKINECFLKPDIVFLLKVRPAVCLEQIDRNRGECEFFERKEKLEKVWLNYENLSRRFPNIQVIDGEERIEEIANQIKKFI